MTLTRPIDHHGWIRTEKVTTRSGAFEFLGGYPTDDAAHRLLDLRTFNRALEVYAEQMPAVSMFQVRRGLAAFGAQASHQIVVWASLMDAKTLLLTGNCETVYGLTFLDLAQDGPTVVDVPPALYGGLLDMWQRSVAELEPSSANGGERGKLLVVSPDYDEEPPEGYSLARSRTYGVLFGVRGFLENGNADAAIASMKSIQIYPLSRADDPPPMQFFDGSNKEIDTIFPDSFEFFEDLAALVEREPADAVTDHERFFLASIGIEKGQPFRPDAGRRKMLGDAACLGSAIARANSFASPDPERAPYRDRRWEWAFIGGSATWDSQGFVNMDRRAAFAYVAIGMSPAMVDRVVGRGSQYLWTSRDATGAHLDGGRNYRLHLPANIPAKQFWSVVVYDAESRSMLDNGQRFPSVSSYTGPLPNADGSVDIYFGPRVAGGREKNWITTVEGKGWFPLLRLYGPLEPFFDATWKPGDIEPIE